MQPPLLQRNRRLVRLQLRVLPALPMLHVFHVDNDDTAARQPRLFRRPVDRACQHA